MNLKKLHYFSGITITLFVVFHLINHLYSVYGAEAHIQLMHTFRIVYRNIIVESILLLAVVLQIVSGISLFWKKRKTASGYFEKLQLYSGLYLALFFIIHLSAVLTGRFIMHLDTNFYFGVAGLNTFPLNLFFVPYYSLAIISFFSHIAAIHSQKMTKTIAGLSPKKQSQLIWILGLIITLITLAGLTNGFTGVAIPTEYNALIGK